MDDFEHTVFYCDRWWIRRRELEVAIEEDFTVDTMTKKMRSSKEKWIAVSEFVSHIILQKEKKERESQAP